MNLNLFYACTYYIVNKQINYIICISDLDIKNISQVV